jgi:hypothetical protein
MVQIDRQWKPDPASMGVYNRYYKAYLACISALRSTGISRVLAELPGSQSGGRPLDADAAP